MGTVKFVARYSKDRGEGGSVVRGICGEVQQTLW